MAADPDDLRDEAEVGRRLNVASLLPGGEPPDAIARDVAILILAALLFLVLLRRGFRGALASSK